MGESRQTALGAARERFVESLPKKAREIRASLALLAGSPSDPRSRDELRRRLHALYASAQVFRIGPLADAVRDAVGRVDAIRRRDRAFTQRELDDLTTLAATIPALGHETPRAESVPPGRAQSGPPSHPPRPAPERSPSVETIVSVLVCDTPDSQARIRAALPPERFEVLAAEDPEEALRLARSGAPDIVLADRGIALRPGVELIKRLRDDPLTDFVPVVLLFAPGTPLDPIAVREAGADEALLKPCDPERLVETVHRVASVLGGPRGASTLTGDLTVEEIAERIAEEVRRGLVETAATGKDLAIPMGDGTPLLAATWSAIGRVRSHLAERSGGRVRFRESPERGGPSFVSVVGEESPEPDHELVDLAHRRVLVVDDDPAVVWFFAGLLREHGAIAIEAEDGMEALEKARLNRPDLVISDILMPRLDGFGLTRALKRDPMLADVPVILISWKEDFLQRMRQLKSGASGYLRKEAGSAQILSAIRDALRPRARLESRLDAGGTVRGRLEEVGVATLLETVARARPDARVTVRDPSSLYELELRDAEIVDVTRTAADGSFRRGEEMLVGLLGATTGRYTIAEAGGAVRNRIEKPLDEVMRDAILELAARVDAVSGRNLAKALRVELDEDVLHGVMTASPEELERVVEPLRAGLGPRDLLIGGDVEPLVLEEFLVDLARQGAIRRVWGPDGEDRIALARDARGMGLHPELSEHDEQGTLSWLPHEETTAQIVLEAEQMAREAAMRTPVPRPPLPSGRRRVETRSDEAVLELTLDGDGDGAAVDEDADTLDLALRSSGPPLPAPELERIPGTSDDPDADAEAVQALEPHDADAHPHADDDEEDAGEEDAGEEDEGEEDEGEEDEDGEDADGEDADELGTETGSPADGGPPTLSVPPAPALVTDADEEEPLSVPPPRPLDPAELAASPSPAAPPATSEGTSWVTWVLVALIVGAVGFLGLRFILGAPPSPEPPEGPLPPTAPSGAEPARATADDTPASETPPALEPPPVEAPGAEEAVEVARTLPPAHGREEAGIASLGVAVGATQGLVVLEPNAARAPMRVELGGRELAVGAEPVAVALAEGVHHVTFVRGDHSDFVWIAVRAGHTRYVPPLP